MFMFEVKEFETKYIVNEEKGIVVCIISDCEENAIALIDEQLNYALNGMDIPNKYILNNNYKGIAKCAAGDTFDEEYGKKLAYKKAYLKYVTALNKKVKCFVDDYKKHATQMIANLDKVMNKTNNRVNKAVETYNKVLEEVE